MHVKNVLGRNEFGCLTMASNSIAELSRRPCLKALPLACGCDVGVVCADVEGLVAAAVLTEKLELLEARPELAGRHVVAQARDRPDFFDGEIDGGPNARHFGKIEFLKSVVSPRRNAPSKRTLAFVGV